MTLRPAKIIGVNLGLFLAVLLLLEAVLQAIALVRPSYEVLFLQPDEVLGWKQVPNLRWTWTGWYWYASDFSVDVQTNSRGFRDLPRELRKPPAVKRVALLGDSFIEAVQVPLERTAAQLLEQSLNRDDRHRWEVLNFGISNYGVGQYLLAWQQHARYYEPDYVAVFVAAFHMRRTVREYEHGAFPATKKAALRVRPSFRLEDDRLIMEPARDFHDFVRTQAELIDTSWSGQRSRRRKRLITLFYARLLGEQTAEFVRRLDRKPDHGQGRSPGIGLEAEHEVFKINSRIIEKLGREVANSGGRLIVVDASRYFGDGENVASALRDLCRRSGFGYVPLYKHLLKANREGIETKWEHDGHFNEAGNEILAEALLDWIREETTVGPNRGAVDTGDDQLACEAQIEFPHASEEWGRRAC